MGRYNKKSKILVWIMTSILVISISGSIVTAYFIESISGDAKDINNLGAIRGNIQRIVKLEMAGKQNVSLIKLIDNNLIYIEKNKESIYLNDRDRISHVDEILKEWGVLKGIIYDYRKNPSNENMITLKNTSEDIWVLSNELVSLSEMITESKINNYRRVYIYGGMNLILAIVTSILIQRYVRDNLEYNIDRDPLTNLFNRRYFSTLINDEIYRCKKFGGTFSLIMLDIDDFKEINDTYGHEVGDETLKDFTVILESSIRKKDILIRLGGDEFIIIAQDANIYEAHNMSENIRNNIQRSRFKHIEQLTISIGSTEYIFGDDYVSIYKRADRALYKAKGKGKNISSTI